ncbi:HET-C-related protein [Xanthomonas sp. WHRI 1810A]|uniref:HET-C-related protein n=1 Tax=Xanthomonas sp. WHRI 1810A TaxID=3161565 RepID=UPI0032E9148D
MNSITLPSSANSTLTPLLEHPPVTPRDTRCLESRFALDQLRAFAQRAEPARFAATMAAIFGYDIAPRHHLTLQGHLLTQQFPMPGYVVDADVEVAEYDNLDRTIRLHPDIIERALTRPERSWELLSILMHEFGHHVDNVLRQDIVAAQEGNAGAARDSAGEEGLRYAQRMALIHHPDDMQEAQIATYRVPATASITLVIDLPPALQHIVATQANPRSPDIVTDAPREGFEAGTGEPGKFTHENIENVLRSLGMNTAERSTVYFGNWMRDYSQLLDPKLVRAENMPRQLTTVFSRKALTQIVDILSIRSFAHLRSKPGLANVSPERLGVYRPSEHIDNPRVHAIANAIDPTTRDADFEPYVLPGDPLLEVDPDTSMKRYIYRSVETMRHSLATALDQGRTDDGLKTFGSALHILEDFFAHSNFVELSLIKVGYTRVLPWTSKAPCKWELPLVTGSFGSLDVVASMAGVVGDIFFPERSLKFDPTREGQRSEWDKMMLIILGEHENPVYLQTFESFLVARDKWASWQGSEYVEFFLWFVGLPAQMLLNAFNAMMREFLRLAGNRVSEHQTNIEDPNTSGSTDPSHSQLSKDHDDHPLHELSALLAKEAVLQVGKAMIDGWEGDESADPVGVATRFICHAMDSNWQDQIVLNWARENPGQLGISTSAVHLNEVHQHVHRVARKAVDKLAKDSKEVTNFFFTPSDARQTFFSLLSLGNPLASFTGNALDIIQRK